MATEASAIGNVYEVRVHGRIELQEYINVINFQAIDDGRDIVDDLANPVYQAYVDRLVPASGQFFKIEKTSVKRVAPTLGPQWDYLGDDADVRTGATEGDTLPSFVSVRSNIRCVRGGKRGRGAISIAGIPDAATIGSTIITDSPYWIGFLDWQNQMKNLFLQGWGLGTKHFLIGVVSRAEGAHKPPYATAQFSTAVNVFALPKVGTQNSRKVGRGS